MEELSLNKKRVRDDSAEFEFDSAEAKRLREDLLLILDDSNPDQDVQEGLFSVMKSFEEEIFVPPSLSPVPEVGDPAGGVESKPDLGYLLGASDDELGLPPPTKSTDGAETGGGKEESELVRVDSAESTGMGDLWGVEGELPNYDAFELGDYETSEYGHVAYDDGWFGYSNVVYDTCPGG